MAKQIYLVYLYIQYCDIIILQKEKLIYNIRKPLYLNFKGF